MLSASELKQYNRSLLLTEIGYQGQLKLKESHVLVVGAGGLGCAVLQFLVLSGVGNIGICDFDVVSVSNLQRQILYGPPDIGRSKAVVAAEKLKNINDFCNITVFNKKLDKNNIFKIIEDFDIIVDGSDNFSTRYLINDACVIKSKVMIFGAVYKFEGQVSVFNYQNGPTYRCLFPEVPDQELPTSAQTGVFAILPLIIGGYQATEVIKVVTGIGKVLSGQLLQCNLLENSFTTINFNRDNQQANVTTLMDYTINNNFTDIQSIEPLQLNNYLSTEPDKWVLIDIRPAEEFELYAIAGINIPLEQLLREHVKLDETKKMILICQSGNKSKAAIEFLFENFGTTNLYNLQGGLDNWILNGLPLIWKTS